MKQLGRWKTADPSFPFGARPDAYAPSIVDRRCLATDNRNYQPGVLRLNISPIGSVIPEKPRVFNRIQEPRAPSWLPPLPRRNFAL
jgi:hypothetical protein